MFKTKTCFPEIGNPCQILPKPPKNGNEGLGAIKTTKDSLQTGFFHPTLAEKPPLFELSPGGWLRD
jgi:hypothetical protein